MVVYAVDEGIISDGGVGGDAGFGCGRGWISGAAASAASYRAIVGRGGGAAHAAFTGLVASAEDGAFFGRIGIIAAGIYTVIGVAGIPVGGGAFQFEGGGFGGRFGITQGALWSLVDAGAEQGEGGIG